MPRIRTIKPEFWSSPDTASASAVARLTYIGMWNWADDYGRGTLNLKELEGFIFPNDDVPDLAGAGTSDGSEGTSYTFRRVVKEVISTFGLEVYEVDRRLYYAIPSWDEHQRTERKAKAKNPGPEEGKDVTDQWIYGQRRKSKEVPTLSEGSTVKGKGSSDIGTGEQGKGNPQSPPPQPDQPEPPTDETTLLLRQSLDELADAHFRQAKAPGVYGTPEDPRCATHVHTHPAGEQPPACFACGMARKWFQEQAAEEATHTRSERRARIESCDQCDENGWITTPAGAIRCTHEGDQ